MGNYALSGLILGSILSTAASAGTMGPPVEDYRWVGSLSGGVAWARAGDNQTFYLTPEIEKSYVAHKTTKSLATGELFVGIQKNWADSWAGQLGLAAGLAGNAKVQGVIWDDADPAFDNHSYAYKIQHSRITVKGKLLKDCGYWLTPWVSGSLGVGFNRAKDFRNTPLIEEALVNPNFSNHTQTAFTYTLGAGLQTNLNDNWQVGIGYEFADWGKSELGRAPEQTLNRGLKLNHLYTNGVLLNITYLA